MKRKRINTAFETVILLLAMAACVLFFLALVAMLMACSKNEDENAPPETTAAENKQTFQILVDNDQREYIMYVPSSYKIGLKYLLVLHLHGGSGTGEKHYNISGWNDGAEANGFLVAYPTAWAYLKTTEDFFQMVRGFDLKRYVTSGDLLATEVEVKIGTPSGKEIILDMTEFYETKNGKIQSAKVHYDAQEFRKEFGLN